MKTRPLTITSDRKKYREKGQRTDQNRLIPNAINMKNIKYIHDKKINF